MSSSLQESILGLRGDKKVQVFEPFVRNLEDEDIAKNKQADIIKRELAANELQQKLAEQFAESVSGVKGMEVKKEGQGIIISLPDSLLFASGSAEVKKKNGVIRLLADNIRTINAQITIEGHTDDVPVVSNTYPSNWELSMARAVNILKLLISEGGIDPARLSAAGYAHTRPLAPNDSAPGRKANRRVNILLTIENI